MDSTEIAKSSSGMELAVVVADGGNGSNDDNGNTREMTLLDTVNNPVHGGDGEMQIDVVEAEGGGGSSSQLRNCVRLTPEQVALLEATFQQNQSPDTEEKKELAERINVSLHKMHVWFQTRRSRFNKMKRDEELKEQVASLTEKVSSLTEQVSSLTEKTISLTEQVSSLTEENRRLENELAKLKGKAAAPVAPSPLPLPAAPVPQADEPVFLLPVPGLAQAFVGLCRDCGHNYRNMLAAGGGASATASTSTSAPPPPSSSARLCPACRSTFRNIAAAAGWLALRQDGAASATTSTPMPPSSSGAGGSI